MWPYLDNLQQYSNSDNILIIVPKEIDELNLAMMELIINHFANIQGQNSEYKANHQI